MDEREDNKQSPFLRFLIENKAMLKPKEEPETVNTLLSHGDYKAVSSRVSDRHAYTTAKPLVEERKLSNLDLLAEIALRQSPEIKQELPDEQPQRFHLSTPSASSLTLTQLINRPISSPLIYPGRNSTFVPHLPPGSIIINPRCTLANQNQSNTANSRCATTALEVKDNSALALQASSLLQHAQKIAHPIKGTSLISLAKVQPNSAQHAIKSIHPNTTSSLIDSLKPGVLVSVVSSNPTSRIICTPSRVETRPNSAAPTSLLTTRLLNPIMSINQSLSSQTLSRRHSEGSSSPISPTGSTVSTSPTHSVDGIIRCDLCGRICSTLAHLNNHIRSVHNNEKSSVPKTIQCKLCPKMFGRSSHLAEHIKTVHEGRKRVYERKACAKCGKEFARQCSLNQHISACHSAHMKV